MNKIIKRVELATKQRNYHINNPVIEMAWSVDNNLLAVVGNDGKITIFNRNNSQHQVELSGHRFATTSIGWSADNKAFASSGKDGYIKLWDLMFAEPRFILPGGANSAEKLAWSPIARYLATLSGNNLRLWDGDGHLLQEYPEHISLSSNIIWKPVNKLNSLLMFATSVNNSIYLWSPEHTKVLKKFETKETILKMAWSGNGRFIVTNNQDSTLHLWDIETEIELPIEVYSDKLTELVWDSTSRFLAAIIGNKITVWNCSSPKLEAIIPTTLKFHKSPIKHIAYQHQGSLLASASEDGMLVISRPERSPYPILEKQYLTSIERIAWSSNGKFLAIGGKNGLVELLLVNI
jgi:WD40 repeat protein